MLNTINNTQSFQGGPIHQMNKLSKKLSEGKILTRCTDYGYGIERTPAKEGGELVRFTIRDNGKVTANLANTSAEIKEGNFLRSKWGVGKTKKAAAKDFLSNVKQGVIFVTDAFTPDRAEYFVKQGKQGIVVRKIDKQV